MGRQINQYALLHQSLLITNFVKVHQGKLSWPEASRPYHHSHARAAPPHAQRVKLIPHINQLAAMLCHSIDVLFI